MKRFILCIFLVLLVSSAFNGCNQKATDIPSESDVGQSSETLEESEATTQDFQYTVNEDNTVFINKYTGSDKHVVIPSEIEGLPVTLLLGIPHEEYTYLAVEGVFENTEIESVVIPETVIKIGDRAFLDCTSLTTVDITKAANLKTIGSTAFKNCNKLEKFVANDKLELIDAQAFDGCTSLKEVMLPNTVTAIKKSAFRDCTALAQINLPSSLVDIEDCAFQNCSSLKTITIPSKVKMINFEGAAFQGNTSLETIIFEDGREEIAGYMCFVIDKSVEIVIPASVKKFSCTTFNIITQTTKTPIKITFLGDCPEITDTPEYFGAPTIYYDRLQKVGMNVNGEASIILKRSNNYNRLTVELTVGTKAHRKRQLSTFR